MNQSNHPHKIRTISFRGTITTVQPVNVSMPDMKGMKKDSMGRPMINAGTIRGKFRHAGRLALQRYMFERGTPTKVDVAYMLGNGTDTARVYNKESNGVAELAANANQRAINPYLSLFGRWTQAGRLSVGNALAQDKSALVMMGGGSRQHIVKDDSTLQFIDKDELNYLADILKADGLSSSETKPLDTEIKSIRKELRATIDPDEKKVLNARIEELEAKIKEIKSERVGADESIQRPLEAFEAIDANVELQHHMALRSPTDLELELFIWTLAMSAYSPYLGGHANVGCGEVIMEWDVSEWSQGDLKPRHIGSVRIDQNGFHCDIDGIDVERIHQQIVSGELDLTRLQ